MKKPISEALKAKMKEHYSPANQRKMAYSIIKKVVKPEFRGDRYKKINETFK